MSQAKMEAIQVLQELMKSATESIRLSAAAAILQFSGSLPKSAETPNVEPSPTNDTGHVLPAAIPEVLRALRFELVDANGKTVAVLGKVDKHPLDGEFVSGGNYGLAILDKDGSPQVRVCGAHPENFATPEGLTMYSTDKEFKVNVAATIAGAALITDFGAKASLYTGMNATGGPCIFVVLDHDFANQRLLLNTDKLQFKDAQGHVMFKAPT